MENPTEQAVVSTYSRRPTENSQFRCENVVKKGKLNTRITFKIISEKSPTLLVASASGICNNYNKLLLLLSCLVSVITHTYI